MNRVRRAVLIGLGLAVTGLGILGIVVPLLPTTPFLLLAGILFANASPRLHSRLLRSRVTGPFIRAYVEGTGLSRNRKIATIGILWATLAVSAWFVRESWKLLALLGAVGVGVTIHVATLRPHRKRAEYGMDGPDSKA